MAYTNFLDNALVAHAVGKTSFTMPSTWVALYTVSPTVVAATGTEAAYTGYARVATSGAWGTPGASVQGQIANAVAIAFAAAGSSATIVAFAIVDSATIGAGNVLMFGACSLAVSSGITPQFAINALLVSQT